MNKDNLIQNYAVALFNNALLDNIQVKICEEITLLNSIIEDSFEIKKFLFSPLVNKIDKINVFNSLVKTTNFNKIVNNFLLLLIKNSRTHILSNIVEVYNKLLYESRNIKIVHVISTNELQPKEQEWIQSRIEKELQHKTELFFDIDNTIIGGIVIKYDNVLRDYSIKGSLEKIAKCLKNVKIC
ncbi:ATP synthase F1 subunit delta [Rickettsia prowazekii]|uniref:ATP synthase subunit delta n=2 Tax=Rickettsia prowazekii TaxID=782 RepID=ATPD_RICPR|nr:ATP synthase F1 subunit delta [Rickettsia prowazekii]Q9ZCF2.1 RecName: Full=ATP synthase subunit delta; AltName: Full=ATP synthase F(1) sector subunit delta; AltName: Full=F-type ATPase subunit delta; Short=F-ATPase subunit delta [Rickettsia prowazekii str. Madrid E]EOB10273.1 ATP synthase subunit delta [Rickettsia prowazekii str. GvF12]ADE30368.1 ATP synthase delta chain [Rickettsia prowazekii str. Rp22]AFE49599.1 F0F1 ATP synthase subunit delta [Rickettsia prowazekii str. Chernikova]AFE50